MANTNIALEIFGICISALLFLCCFIETSASEKQNKIFIGMLSINILVLLCDLLTWVFENKSEHTVMLYAINFLVYSLGYVLTALFTCYLIDYISTKDKISKLIAPITVTLCFIAILPVVVSLFNHMYFTFDNGIYKRGNIYWLSQFYPIGIMLTDMVIVFNHRKALGLHDTLSLLSYGVLPIVAMVIQIKTYGITLLYIATTASLLVIYIMIHVEQNRHLEKQKAELAKANISIMLSQIQPHFLYNSLAVIKELCYSNPELAGKVTVDFSNYLRGNLDSLKAEKPIRFVKELEHTKTFLSLEKMQYGDNLNVIYNIKSDAFLIPTLTLQPLAENAVKYGMKQKEHITVKISSYEDEINFYVVVEDDGLGFDTKSPLDSSKSHIGISNVRNRLAVQSQSILEIKSIPGEGTTAIIIIPKERK